MMQTDHSLEDRRRPAALNLASARPGTSESSSSDGSLKPRTPRFAEATSVHSPVEARSPFADPEKSHVAQPQPADVGFGYIGQRESIPVPMTPKTPLKSAMKVPGTPAHLKNPLSPTFREEDILEKREASTDKEQARDVVCNSAITTDSATSHLHFDRKSRPESAWPSSLSVVLTLAALLLSLPCFLLHLQSLTLPKLCLIKARCLHGPRTPAPGPRNLFLPWHACLLSLVLLFLSPTVEVVIDVPRKSVPTIPCSPLAG